MFRKIGMIGLTVATLISVPLPGVSGDLKISERSFVHIEAVEVQHDGEVLQLRWELPDAQLLSVHLAKNWTLTGYGHRVPGIDAAQFAMRFPQGPERIDVIGHARDSWTGEQFTFLTPLYHPACPEEFPAPSSAPLFPCRKKRNGGPITQAASGTWTANCDSGGKNGTDSVQVSCEGDSVEGSAEDDQGVRCSETHTETRNLGGGKTLTTTRQIDKSMDCPEEQEPEEDPWGEETEEG